MPSKGVLGPKLCILLCGREAPPPRDREPIARLHDNTRAVGIQVDAGNQHNTSCEDNDAYAGKNARRQPVMCEVWTLARKGWHSRVE